MDEFDEAYRRLIKDGIADTEKKPSVEEAHNVIPLIMFTLQASTCGAKVAAYQRRIATRAETVLSQGAKEFPKAMPEDRYELREMKTELMSLINEIDKILATLK